MISVEIAPSPALRPYVQLFWCLELDGAPAAPSERIAPDGIVELIFHYRDPFACRFDGEPFATQPRSSLISQTRRYVEIRQTRSVGLLTVRFRPWGGYHFFAPPVKTLADRLVLAEDLWPSVEVRELELYFTNRFTRLADLAD
jgi:hypothetical protein